MAKAEITFRPRFVAVKEKVMRKLSWYDSKTQTAYEDEGGDIAFRYDPRTKRNTPYVVDVFLDKKSNTYEYIEKFVKGLNFDYKIISEVPNREIVIELDEEELKGDYDYVLSQLEFGLSNNKFCEYSINEND